MDLMLSNDSGTSLSKNIYRLSGGEPQLHLMEPEVACLRQESLDDYLASQLGRPDPKNEAWVQFGGKLYAVGFLAQKVFDASIPLKGHKYERAIPKLLAAVGTIAIATGLPDRFSLSAISLLPYKEWENRELFERRLQEALAEFVICGRRLSVRLEHFLCRPEGSGLIWSRSRQEGQRFRQKKVAALMLGYRDASIALVDRGVTSGATVPLGMSWMLQRVQQRTSGQRLSSLVAAVHKAGSKIRPEKFSRLALSEDPENQVEESTQIAEAVRISRQEYWDAISRWLRSAVPADLDEVVVAGGTAEYLKSELKGYFGRVPMSWAAEVEEDVQRAFNLGDRNLCLRLADSYGAFRCLNRQVFPGPVELGRSK